MFAANIPVFALITLAPLMLPPVPPALTIAPVRFRLPPTVALLVTFALPALMFAANVPVFALMTLAPVKLPPLPPAETTVPVTLILPPMLALLDTLAVPATFIPVPVTTIIFALPAELNVMFPLANGIFTLLFPLLMLAPPPPPDIPVN